VKAPPKTNKKPKKRHILTANSKSPSSKSPPNANLLKDGYLCDCPHSSQKQTNPNTPSKVSTLATIT
jgi:hypothetical protein